MNRATIEALLVGVPLPATKAELLDYARRQPHGDEAATLLRQLPDGEYRALQDVGEALEPRQVAPPDSDRPLPRPESDLPPGGGAYVGGSEPPANVVASRAVE